MSALAARRFEARALLAILAVAATVQAGAALVAAVQLAREAGSRRKQSHADATLRALGGTYVHALAVARRALPPGGTVYFVDEESEPRGAAYFALYYLAPRKLVRLGSTRENSARWLSQQVPPEIEQILIVGGSGAPLEVVPVAEYGARSRAR